MSKRGSDGVLLKKQRALLSQSAVAKLEAEGNITKFRTDVRKLGYSTEYKTNGKWCHRTKASIIADLKQALQEVPAKRRATIGGDGSSNVAEVQGRDAIRARAAELGVKRCKWNGSTGQITWKNVADLSADCNTAIQLDKKCSLTSLFDRQLKSHQAAKSE